MSPRVLANCLFLTMLVSVPVSGVGKEPLQLDPSSKWLINYGVDSCRLARKFGTGDQEILLTIDRFGPGDFFNLAIGGKLAEVGGTSESMSIQFGPEEAEQRQDFKPSEMSDKRPGVIFVSAMRLAPLTDAEKAVADAAKDGDSYDLAAIGPEREKAVSYIRLEGSLEQPLTMMTGSMAGPFAALRKCTDELIEHWGVDVAALATQSRQVRPIGKIGHWLSSSDYPVSLQTRAQQGIIHFRLSVGADGKPAGCHIQQSTRPAEFDDAICKGLMKRAKFAPALDAAGHPIASYFISTVRFQI